MLKLWSRQRPIRTRASRDNRRARPWVELLEDRVTPTVVGGEVFLQGNFIEVGIHAAGSFGTAGVAPAGFHPKGVQQLGFVVDPGKDGWNTGSPAQSGDYFLPGTPEEGWGIKWDNTGGGSTFLGNFGRVGSFQISQTSLVETSSGATPTNGLVSVWRGEGNASDSWGANHGASQNGATFAAGKIGQAFNLDGINDYVTIADSNSLETGGAHTIAGWIRTTPGTSSVVFSKYQDDTPTEDGWSLAVLSDGRLQGLIKNSSGNGVLVNSTRSVGDGQFHHVAMTWDTNSGRIKLYIDGTFDSQSGTLSGSFAGNSRSMLIGARHRAGGLPPHSPFPGQIDEVYAYNRALSESEIAPLANAASHTRSAVWEGVATSGANQLRITQTVRFNVNDQFFVINVVLTNIGTTTLNNLRYLRNVDPDQEQPLTGDYTTDNYVVFQPPHPGINAAQPADNANRALVVARGLTHGITLGLGTIDSRATVSTEGFTNRNPDDILNSPNMPTQASPQRADQAIALAFQLGNLAPGQSTSIDYAYVLNQADLDAALGQLAAVTILQPTGTVSGNNVLFQATTDDVANTAQIEFFVNGTSIGVDSTASGGVFEKTFNSLNLPNGNLNLRVVATFTDGQVVEKTSSVTVDNAGPGVTVTTPLFNQLVSGDSIPIAVAIDSPRPVRVSFFREVAGASLFLGEDSSAPFSSSFSVSDLAPGTNVVIKVVATDDLGRSTTVQVPVRVNVPPQLVLGPALETIQKGTVVSRNVFIVDPDSSSFTAAVDFGDGAGFRTIPVFGPLFDLGAFGINYTAAGVYTVQVKVTDDAGAVSNVEQFVLEVSYNPPSITAQGDVGAVVINPATSDFAGWIFDDGVGGAHDIVNLYTALDPGNPAPPTYTTGGNFAVLYAADEGSFARILSPSFHAKAGDVLRFFAFFDAGDYFPYDDFGEVRLLQVGPPGLGEIPLLGGLLPLGELPVTPVGPAVTLYHKSRADVGDYGQTPWTLVEYTITEAGIYQLEGRVTNLLDSGLDSVLGLAFAGNPAGTSVFEGSNVSLHAVPDADMNANGPLTYSWTVSGIGTFSGQDINFTAPNGPAVVNVSLTVTDSTGKSATSHTSIFVTNAPPQFEAGADATVAQRVTFSRQITITDPGQDISAAVLVDGTPISATLVHDGGSQYTLSFSTSFTTVGQHTVTVRVSDDSGTVEDSFQVNVFNPVTADAGGPYSVTEGGTVQLNGSGASSVPGDVTYAWDLDNDGTFETVGQSVTFSALASNGPAAKTVGLQVTDSLGNTQVSIATVSVSNVAPSFNAGADTQTSINTQFQRSVLVSDPGKDVSAVQVLVDDVATEGVDATHSLNPETFLGLSSFAVAIQETFAQQGTFRITVRVTDDTGTVERSFLINVFDPHESELIGDNHKSETVDVPINDSTPPLQVSAPPRTLDDGATASVTAEVKGTGTVFVASYGDSNPVDDDSTTSSTANDVIQVADTASGGALPVAFFDLRISGMVAATVTFTVEVADRGTDPAAYADVTMYYWQNGQWNNVEDIATAFERIPRDDSDPDQQDAATRGHRVLDIKVTFPTGYEFHGTVFTVALPAPQQANSAPVATPVAGLTAFPTQQVTATFTSTTQVSLVVRVASTSELSSSRTEASTTASSAGVGGESSDDGERTANIVAAGLDLNWLLNQIDPNGGANPIRPAVGEDEQGGGNQQNQQNQQGNQGPEQEQTSRLDMLDVLFAADASAAAPEFSFTGIPALSSSALAVPLTPAVQETCHEAAWGAIALLVGAAEATHNPHSRKKKKLPTA